MAQWTMKETRDGLIDASDETVRGNVIGGFASIAGI